MNAASDVGVSSRIAWRDRTDRASLSGVAEPFPNIPQIATYACVVKWHSAAPSAARR
jgi:hypothetical protein